MQLGYHRVSDDSVTSMWVEGKDLEAMTRDVLASDDIDRAWVRATMPGPVTGILKGSAAAILGQPSVDL